jgi:hypothetical protein
MASNPITLTIPKPKPVATFSLPNGLQGSNVNPQQTAPSTILQNPNVNPQPAAPGVVLQNGYNPQAAANALALATAQAQAAAAVEVARQKEATRVRVQGEFNTKVATNKQQIISTVSNPTWKGKIVLGKQMKLPQLVLPKDTRSEYQKQYDDAYAAALADVQKKGTFGRRNVVQRIWDKATFGGDKQQINERNYAAKAAQDVVDKSTKSYENNLASFLKTQAQKKSEVEGAKYLTQAQFDQAAASYNAWQTAEIAKLEKQRAITNGQIDAYGKASSAQLTSATARAAAMFNRDIVHGVPGKVLGNVWQYTLGQGSTNAPSVVTAPSRLVNFLGNLNTKDRTIYQEGGTSTNRANSNLNAWQITANQRTLNQKPWVDIKPGKQADQSYGQDVKALIAARKAAGEKDPAKLDYNKVMAEKLAAENTRHKHWNSFVDVAADPLNLAAGAGAAARGLGYTDKLAAASKTTKLGGWISKATDTISKNKVVSWLASEHKSPTQRLSEAIDESKAATDKAQRILPMVNSINQQIIKNGGRALDLSVFEDLKGLSDTEAKILQRMSAGKLTARDRVFLAGKNYAPVRSKLEGIAAKWQDFEEQMRSADNVVKTSYGLGKKRMYFARIDHTGDHTLEDYNFYARKRSKGYQSSGDLNRNQVDRYFKSDLDTVHAANQSTKVLGLKQKRADLIDRYTKQVMPSRQAALKAQQKLPWYLKSDKPTAKVARVVANNTPTKLWKKSVLKYRPAWYLNNELYNTQATLLAGGTRAGVEKLKMLNPRYFKKAMDQLPTDAKSNIVNEVGNGKLGRFAARQENWSRVAAYRANIAKGLTHEQALKRVNRYLFDYSTKNWERPIKAVIPFWQFQKNVAKAAAVMPFDRPVWAEGYHRLDTYQQQQFNNDFNTTIPELKKLGYTDAEIEKFRQDNAKYYKGRLKVGGKYITTPFNAFSDKQMSQLGFNPYLAAAGETAQSVDSFNQPIKGKEASFWRRLASKFPQADLGIQAKQALDVQAGRSKPDSSWIANPGHEGYGLTKQKQGFDKSKPNYVPSMDPRAKLGSKALSFLGQPSSLSFGKTQFVTSKRLQKATQSYFATNWDKVKKDQGFAEMQKQQKDLFKKYGLTPDGFYKGILSKYDSEQTTAIKKQKSDAAIANTSLFAEYAAQPKGTRNLWATQKLKQLVDNGYFEKNPFLQSFDWITPATVSKAKTQANYKTNQKTVTYSQHRSTGVQVAGKWFKSPESAAKATSFAFWQKYYSLDRAAQKKLLAENPQYNTRSDWTAAMWAADKAQKKAKLHTAALGLANFDTKVLKNKTTAQTTATRFLSSVGKSGGKKVKWKLATK